MSQSILKQDQRKHLLTLMERRLHKLDDKALLELEQLTRNPQQLIGFVPTTKTVAVMTSSVLPQVPFATVHRLPKGAISRRQLLAGLGAVATVGVVGGGMYVFGARGTHRNAERYAQLNAAVQAAIDYLDSNVTTLTEEALDTADAARVLRDVATNCLDSYPGMRVALEMWWTETSVVKQDYQAMQLVEGGVKAMTEVLSMLAALPNVAIRVLGDVVEVELGNLDAFRSALQAVGDLLTHLDPALHTADVAHEYLSPWFSGVAESDIKHRLLYPLEDEFSPRVINLGTQCQQLQLDWKQRFIQPVNAARQYGT